MASPILNVNVIAETKKFSSGMKSAIGDTNGLTDGLKKFGIAAGIASAAAVAALTAFSVSAVKAASDLQETNAAVEQVFGASAKSLQDFAKEAPTLLGQTQNQFLTAAKTFGIFGQAAGLAGEENAQFSKELAILATDLASFNNTSVDDAITALGAALRGESEPIRRYGVLLDDATLKARAAELGIYSGNGALTQQQKVLAANAEIFAQTNTQQGDFARTSDGLANGIKILTAQFDNLKLVLGEALYPVVAAIVPEITKFIEQLTASPEFEQFVSGLAETFQMLFNALTPMLPVIFDLISMLLPPLMEIVQALAPIVVKLVEAFMPLIQALLPPLLSLVDAIIPVLDILVESIVALIPAFVELINALAPLFEEEGLTAFQEILKALPGAIKVVADVIIWLSKNVIAPLVEGIAGLVGWLNDLLGIGGGNKQSAPTTNFRGRPKLAEGGIVMPRPGGVPVTVAEAGQAEAIIPLNKMGQFGGGTQITIQGNVGWSPEDLANIITRRQRQALALNGLNGIVGVR